jgi:hypothetical protein
MFMINYSPFFLKPLCPRTPAPAQIPHGQSPANTPTLYHQNKACQDQTNKFTKQLLDIPPPNRYDSHHESHCLDLPQIGRLLVLAGFGLSPNRNGTPTSSERNKDTMKITKKESLQLTAKLWTWLAKNPANVKYEWTEWSTNGGKVQPCTADCPLCEYAENHSQSADYCPACPLSAFWKKFSGAPSVISVTPCNSEKSPFVAWRFADDHSCRTAAALQIAKAAKQALKPDPQQEEK